MVIEESSVVGGCFFLLNRGGFKTEIVDTVKVGQVHFEWKGKTNDLYPSFQI